MLFGIKLYIFVVLKAIKLTTKKTKKMKKHVFYYNINEGRMFVQADWRLAATVIGAKNKEQAREFLRADYYADPLPDGVTVQIHSWYSGEKAKYRCEVEK